MTEPGASSRSVEIKKFVASFSAAKGALSTVVITLSLSFALGCTVAIVPEILSDRYARLHHGYDWTLPCSSFDDETMPIACRRGSDDAQDASAWSSLLQNLLTLFFNPVVGKMSDIHGRRRIFILAIFTYTFAPLTLVAMELYPTMQPVYYYLASCLIGIISYSSISFAIISDSVPEEFRTASFGIIMAGFYSGFCLSPLLALVLTHMHVSILSFTLTFAALVYASIYFPETLPTAVREANHQLLTNQENEAIVASFPAQIGALLTRPFREMSILNRDMAIRLVAIGSFFSSMVYSTDANLVIFYIEEYLDVREDDIAYQFLLMGVVGVVMQGCLLQPLLKCFGDKGLLIISFLSGTTHNLLYGVAKNKQTLYVALSLSQLTKINGKFSSILSSLVSSASDIISRI